MLPRSIMNVAVSKQDMGLTSRNHNLPRLKQLPYKFAGPLPEQKDDETRVPCRSQGDDWWDPLLQGQITPALTLDVGRRFSDVQGQSLHALRDRNSGSDFLMNCCRALIQQLRFDYDEASWHQALFPKPWLLARSAACLPIQGALVWLHRTCVRAGLGGQVRVSPPFPEGGARI